VVLAVRRSAEWLREREMELRASAGMRAWGSLLEGISEEE